MTIDFCDLSSFGTYTVAPASILLLYMVTCQNRNGVDCGKSEDENRQKS